MHDFAALAASVRHGATSIAEIVREHLGSGAGRAMMGFIWIALIYVIVAFTDITAGTFVGGSEELKATAVNFNPGGAVAAASILYLLLSVVLGLVQRYLHPPLWLVTVIFVPAAFAVSWIGTLTSNLFVLDHKTWGVLIIIYCGSPRSSRFGRYNLVATSEDSFSIRRSPWESSASFLAATKFSNPLSRPSILAADRNSAPSL